MADYAAKRLRGKLDPSVVRPRRDQPMEFRHHLRSGTVVGSAKLIFLINSERLA
jgi:hypothetical protein